MDKQCESCGEIKDISLFQFRKDSQKYRNECKECCVKKNREWKKVTITNDSLRDIIMNYDPYALEQIKDWARVKHLDREDIESLGWEIDKTRLDGETQLKFYKDNKCLYYRKENHEIGIFTIDPSKNDYYSRYNVDPTKVHIIIIKNKSELKRLLKQLGI